MKPAIRILVIIAIVMTSVTARASAPVVQGLVSGIELCPQSICGVAVFAGVFKGRIGINPFAIGTIAVAVHHGPLPFIEDVCTPVPDGVWVLSSGLRRIEGGAAGTLCYNGDNTWHISVDLVMTSPGTSGTLNLEGTLDHNKFPPTVQGLIFQ